MDSAVAVPPSRVSDLELLETLLIALSVTGLYRVGYFRVAPWIWSQNTPVSPAELTPWMRKWNTERDGVEVYALYLLVLAIVVTSLACCRVIRLPALSSIRRPLTYVCGAIAALHLASTGFVPPMNTLQAAPIATIIGASMRIALVTFSILAALTFLQRRSGWLELSATAALLVPLTFVATSPIDWLDYSYVFAPGLRLLHGAKVADVYFQYDLLLSLLAATWMKLGLALDGFRVLGQASYYLSIGGLFLVARKLFLRKELATLMVAVLVMIRIYASPWDATNVFQVTPLRLDLWLLILLAVYHLPPHHWGVGLACGFLVVVATNFGIIYSLAYLQLLLSLFLIEQFDGGRPSGRLRGALTYARRCLPAVALILLGWVTHYALVRGSPFPGYANYYRSIGIGFLPIARNSFYWYVPAVLSAMLALLVGLRKVVSARYLASGLLLIDLAIGNSIYFFGRSHEHNLINIAVVLVFALFFTLDLMQRYLTASAGGGSPASSLRLHGVRALAVGVIVIAIGSYSATISGKASTQFGKIASGAFMDPSHSAATLQRELADVRELTGGSSRVYFVANDDFLLYYYGQYAPVGYATPLVSWLFTRDLDKHLQGLLDDGYFLVCRNYARHLLSALSPGVEQASGDFVIVSARAATRPLAAGASCTAPPAGIVSWWPGDDSGRDRVGPNHAMLVGGTAPFHVGISGGLRFNRPGAYVEAATVGLPVGGDDRSIELWVKVEGFPTQESFLAGYGDYRQFGGSITLGLSGGRLFGSNFGEAVLGPAVTTDRWHHVGLTYRGKEVTLYLDGQPVASGQFAIDTPATSTLYMGTLPGPLGDSRRLDGYIDEAAVYGRALSGAEMRAIADAGSAGKCR